MNCKGNIISVCGTIRLGNTDIILVAKQWKQIKHTLNLIKKALMSKKKKNQVEHSLRATGAGEDEEK